MFLDATYVKARVDRQVVSRSVVTDTGVTADANREVLGVDDSEDELIWTGFLRSLKNHGLDEVKLVISDAHAGLKAAIARMLQGTARQRCRVHLIRTYAVSRLVLFVAKRHKQHRSYGWKAVVHLSPNMLGLVNLNGWVVAPRPNRPWLDKPNATR